MSLAFLPLTAPNIVSLNLVDPQLLERFERAGIKTLIDLTLYTSLELSLKFRLSVNQAKNILERLFSCLKIKSQTAFEILCDMPSAYIPTKLPSLNRYLNGGLRRGSLVELCGSWGSGKTQFCLHLAAECCQMGYRSIYIDTEQTFSSVRLLNMLNESIENREQLLELIRTETVFDYESLMNTLNSIENQLDEESINAQTESPVVLLIIDSIAAPLRMSTSGYSREYCLLLFTDCVKRLASRSNILILVTNQVTTKRRSNVLNDKVESTSSNDAFYMSVALGKAWSYSVNVRLAICYQGDTRRQLIIGKSIESPSYTIDFRILNHGIEEIQELLLTASQQQRTRRRRPLIPLIQADEMQLIGKQLRP